LRLNRTACAAAILAGLALWPAAARADDAGDRRAAAVTLLDQLHSADAIMVMMPNIIGQIRTNLTHNDATLGRQFDGIAPRLQAEADAAKPALIEKLVDIYAATFTLDELHQMSDFYRTPAGLKMVASQSQLSNDVLAAAREWGTGIARTLAKEAAAELQGTGQ
jgi:hypothetical protein